jgi:hypothetical protein
VIEELTRDYLARVDAALPGFVRGLYVVGSAALGAWQPGRSDVDAIILTSRPAGDGDLAVLAELHAGMPASPHFDGVYLEPALAQVWPTDRPVVPFVVNGTFTTDRPCGELTPVVWLTLQRYGIAVRGPRAGELGVRVDGEALRRYNLDNLRDYWQPLIADLPAAVAQTAPGDEADAGSVAWLVLGPARLHYTLAHGDITSKAGAAAYLAGLLPEYAGLAGRAVRWRAGEPVAFTVADLRAAGDSVHAVADDAWRRFGP